LLRLAGPPSGPSVSTRRKTVERASLTLDRVAVMLMIAMADWAVAAAGRW
jgi:hypothetical protein